MRKEYKNKLNSARNDIRVILRVYRIKNLGRKMGMSRDRRWKLA